MFDKIILGTVQLGLSYGINNSVGKPTLKNSLAILDQAFENQMVNLDTSDLYGESQDVIARSSHKKDFKIFSKFSLEDNMSICTHLDQTLKTLGLEQIEGYSFHRIDDFFKFNQMEEVVKLKTSGKCKYLGVTVYTNDQLRSAIESPFIDLIQLPLNLLDHEKMKEGLIELAKAKGKLIHIRSVFLQGLFFKKLHELTGNLKSLRKNLGQIHELAQKFGLSIEELALGYVLNLKNIDGVLIGVETVEQLKRNQEIIRNIKYSDLIKNKIEEIIVEDRVMLNPAVWRLE